MGLYISVVIGRSRTSNTRGILWGVTSLRNRSMATLARDLLGVQAVKGQSCH
jgi:hypothetical protein